MLIWLNRKIESYFFPEISKCGVCGASSKVCIIQMSSGEHTIKITCSAQQEHLAVSQLSKTSSKKTERGMQLSLKFAFRKAARSWNAQSKKMEKR